MRKVQVEVRVEHLEQARKDLSRGEAGFCHCIIAKALISAGLHDINCGVAGFDLGNEYFDYPKHIYDVVWLFDSGSYGNRNRDAEILARLPLTFEVEVPDAA